MQGFLHNYFPHASASAAPEDFILGIELGNTDLEVWAAYDAALNQDVYQGSISFVTPADVIVADDQSPQNYPDLVDFGDTDWSDWSWAQAPPIDDLPEDALPDAIEFSDDPSYGYDLADYGFSVDPLSDDNNPEFIPQSAGDGLDTQDFTDTADYSDRLDPQSEDFPEDQLLGQHEPEQDYTDHEPYGFDWPAGFEQDQQLGTQDGLDDQDWTDLTDYSSQTDPLSDDGQVFEDFILGIEDGNNRDDTDYADYGSQSDQMLEPQQDFLLGQHEPEQDYTDLDDYGFSVGPLSDDFVSPVDCIYPDVISTTLSNDTAETASHVVTLPATIGAGDRVIILYGGTLDTVSFSAGWTEFFERISGVGNASVIAGAYRDCDGSEGGGTVTITSTSSFTAGFIVYRIRAGTFDPATAPEVSSTAQATNTSPNTTTLTPSWGTDYNLWITTFAYGQTAANSISAYPTDYTDNQAFSIGSGGATFDGCVGAATRNLVAPSEDPGAFTTTVSGRWIGVTIAVRGECGVVPLGAQDNDSQDFTDLTEYGFIGDPVGADAGEDLVQSPEPDQDFSDQTDYGFSNPPLSDDNNPEFIPHSDGSGLDAQDFTDQADYGDRVDPLPDDFPQDFLLGISEPEQDYTDLADYGFVNWIPDDDSFQDFALGTIALDEQDFTDQADYGFALAPQADDFPEDQLLSSVSEPEQDYTDHADYGMQIDPLSDDAPDTMLGVSEPEQDYTDFADYSFISFITPDDITVEDFLLGQHEPEQDYTDRNDYSYYVDPANQADVSVEVVGGGIVIEIGCFHVIVWNEIPDVSALWTEITDPSTDWTEIPNVANTWIRDC